MAYFAGLDVSVKETSVCIVDDTGKIVRETRVASEPGVVDSLKALDPERPIREADVHLRSCYVAFVPFGPI